GVVRAMAVSLESAGAAIGSDPLRTRPPSGCPCQAPRRPCQSARMPIDWRAATLAANDATYAAWNAHDPDAVARVFADDAVTRESGRPEELRGRAAIRARAAAMLAAFPDFRLERLAL